MFTSLFVNEIKIREAGIHIYVYLNSNFFSLVCDGFDKLAGGDGMQAFPVGLTHIYRSEILHQFW